MENLDKQHKPRTSQSGSDNNVIIINFQIIINGIDITNETLRKYSEFLENITTFNLNAMKNCFESISPYPFYPRLEDKK
ncbi:MAG: hypothetical protein P0116_09605 [Candidatus Nitrosocosmicus sp.]|nr:hypothetical protein [Candidatus Nitrosocosmicus sp.]